MSKMFKYNEETGQFEITGVSGLLSIDIASEEWQRANDEMRAADWDGPNLDGLHLFVPRKPEVMDSRWFNPITGQLEELTEETGEGTEWTAGGIAPYVDGDKGMVVDWNRSPAEQPDFDMIDHLRELMKQCRVQAYRVDRCDTIEAYVGRQSVPPTLAELLERFPLYDNVGRLGRECWQRGLGFYGAGVMNGDDGMTFTLTAETRVFVVEDQLLWWLDATADVADNLRGVSDA